MTDPDDVLVSGDAAEADVVEQLIPVEVADDDTGLDLARIALSRDGEVNEADLIDQATAVPLVDDDAEFDR